MGTSQMGSAASSDATIRKFYTSAAWIEGRAEDQLDDVSGLPGVTAVAAFPDLHPGKYGPVGCAVLSDKVHPHLAGGDIGCGMSLFRLDLAPRRIKPDKAAARMRGLGDLDDTDHRPALESAGLSGDLFPQGLGTIGGGNHFCELQVAEDGMDASCAYLLVHSGSRGLGTAILLRQLSEGLQHYDPDDAAEYLAEHDDAVAWARLNRQIVADRAGAALRADVSLVVDAPHNLITPVAGGWLHRKGAAVAGGLVPLAGTRATASYLIDTSDAGPDTLASAAHGAGRRYDRRSMHGRVSNKRSSLEALRRPASGGRVICDDKGMLIEEAPKAYKSVEQVLADLETFGIARQVGRFRPVVTFKNTKDRA